MRPRHVQIITVAVVAGIMLHDVILASDEVEGNTYSAVIRAAARRAPMVPFAAGVLVGHWFWNE